MDHTSGVEGKSTYYIDGHKLERRFYQKPHKHYNDNHVQLINGVKTPK